jgi:peptidoglycan/LPS O-acetylase OafA/YrhL
MSPSSDSTTVTGNTAQTRPENRAFYPALDGMRAIAFLMVFCHHYLHLPWGWAGVDLFFVLSGFLITGILFDTRNDPNRARNFYIRRTLRIFPLYYGVMIALLLLEPIAHWHLSWGWLVWPAYLGNYAGFIHPYAAGDALQKLADFQPNGTLRGGHPLFFLGHFWSLCVEEQFYLAWPWLVFWIRDRRKLLFICAATVPLCLAMRLTGQHFLPMWMLENQILYRATPFRLDALLLGGFLALVIRGDYGRTLLLAARPAFPIAIALIFFFALLPANWPLWHYPFPLPDWKYTWGLSAIDFFSALLILVSIQPGTWMYRALCARLLRWIGRISYGAYVLHDIPHLLYLDVALKLVRIADSRSNISEYAIRLQATVFAAVIALTFTLIFAWLSFRFFESPFLNLKERWTRREIDRT